MKNFLNILIPSSLSLLLSVFCFVFLFSYPAISKVYFCEDTVGDLELNRQFFLYVEGEVISKEYIKRGGQISPKTEEKIVFKNLNSLVAFDENYSVGVKTFSMHEGKNGVWKAIRTYVEEDFSFSQKSDCFVQ